MLTKSTDVEDEYFDYILLSNVRRRDSSLLKLHLLTLSNPTPFLNRIHDIKNEQKCTILALACVNGDDEIVRMLVEDFHPDLEVLNQVRIIDKDGRYETFYDATVLWIAAALNNFSMVKFLVEKGAEVNHKTRTKSTPLRCACCNDNIEMARFLVSHGADIRINKEKHYTNLIASVFNGHLEMVSYLVEDLHCDVNECLDDGRSPLGAAVYHGSVALVQYLLDRGAKNFPEKFDRMSPLMLAADKRREDLIEIIAPHCSLVEQIEAEELLGSAFACAEIGECDFDRSFEHLSRAMKMRISNNLPKTIRRETGEPFQHRQECQTIEQLDFIRKNRTFWIIEVLLNRERILGPINARYRHALCYYGAMLADNDQYHSALAFWIYELKLHQQYSIEIEKENLRHFLSLFAHMQSLSLKIPMESIEFLINVIRQELEKLTKDFEYHFYTLIFFISILSQIFIDNNLSSDDDDRKKAFCLIHSIVKRDYRMSTNGSSLFHSSLNPRLTTGQYRFDSIYQYPSYSTIQTLIRCGANVNVIDRCGNTPLHVYLTNNNIPNEQILDLFCQADAHLDWANEDRRTPLDLICTLKGKQWIRNRLKINLKCICARHIRKAKISIDDFFNDSLREFVERH